MSTMRARPVTVLIVDDEPALIEIMSASLGAREYEVLTAATGTEALQMVSVGEPDVVLLDIGLPDIDGVSVCRQLRSWFSNPIIILSADGGEDRKVEALDAGADDYVTKPFSSPELFARIRVALRHREVLSAVVDPTEFRVGDLVIDVGAHSVTAGGEALSLTRKEYALLVLLARNVGRVLAQADILGNVWGPTQRGTAESLRVHVTNLRRKLGSGDERPRIVTEPGVGYRMV